MVQMEMVLRQYVSKARTLAVVITPLVGCNQALRQRRQAVKKVALEYLLQEVILLIKTKRMQEELALSLIHI